ncbi:hypothetical protein [Flavobacterium sp. ASW18X]|uniref:hypothetical protein n=1 Tax=Flavobacterium sp. ASW18X TaxID=2572595 RepID=UPI0010AE1320|nr:hypothetical protein [Flavobacterium sp. ASW18X]TKD62321.1 hypothetical protein FBT53_10355 [Flavobacterium sp. ASW18X]
MRITTNKYLVAALILALIFHGAGVFFTIEKTYDALIHLFFADHYANSWWDPWEPRWYTGFSVMTYPPLVHQLIALFSYIGGLKFGLFVCCFVAITLFTTGAYRYGKMMTGNRDIAGFTALIAVFSSSFIETLHVFGQLPSLFGVSMLMHAMPEVYKYIKTGKGKYYLVCMSMMAFTITSHHVTPLFGMVFFIAPLMGTVVMDVASERAGSFKAVRLRHFMEALKPCLPRIVIFGLSVVFCLVMLILPYWITTHNEPITQVPIPHGSRDSFLEVTSSGLAFFIIPWGFMMFIFPYFYYRFFSKRFIFFGLSFAMLSLLGTGGTTPLPRLLLGDTAFNILTLDRFTLWGSIMALPFYGEFLYRFAHTDLKAFIQKKLGSVTHRAMGAVVGFLIIFNAVSIVNLGYFKPLQPQKINMQPIINFLQADEHYKWRYLTLGFGDQMAWLSANTNALQIDGNYHSARRLPELTTRAVERLENAKFLGVEGLGSLQQFLTVPDKYNIKFIFSNDKFYDPILYFCGWERIKPLANGIAVWQRLGIKPIPEIKPYKDYPRYQRLMWGIIPVSTVLIALFVNIRLIVISAFKLKKTEPAAYEKFRTVTFGFKPKLAGIMAGWFVFTLGCIFYIIYFFFIQSQEQISPENVILAYHDDLDFKRFKKAHSYYDEDYGKTFDQFMLETSVSDGLLNSYGKLNGIEFDIFDRTENHAKARVYTEFITPLTYVLDTTVYELNKKKDNKWYIVPDVFDVDVPNEQLYSVSEPKYKNHGRRRVTTQQTFHEDIVPQPVVEVLEAKLIESDNQFYIIGRLQNIDNLPADINVKSTIYTKDYKEMGVYNAQNFVKHKLLPKEHSAFKIHFEAVAWQKIKDSMPQVFDPDTFTPMVWQEYPQIFDLQISANGSSQDLYREVTLNDVQIEDDRVTGYLYNYGISDVTIPQLIISYYNDDNELVWVDEDIVMQTIRPQRKSPFEFKLKKFPCYFNYHQEKDSWFVNGLPNDDIKQKYLEHRKPDLFYTDLIPVDGDIYSYIKIEINNYIGSPD